jgi:hypothetical protein
VKRRRGWLTVSEVVLRFIDHPRRTLTATVGAVLDAFATRLSPIDTGSSTPTFS